MSALIALLRGWGLPVRIVLDSDKSGEKEKKRYKEDFFLSDNEISLLGTLEPTCNEIEDVFSARDKASLGALVGKKTAAKKDIMALVQEHLASEKKLSIEDATLKRMRQLLNVLEKFQH